ncbi:oxygenase MpaB family protein [Mycolicibacterium vaccae]|uniref:oxygenase MpaB family protein n=1 Tax=Mycolicibacterium vaccae TaxID=1810 RepID=UPI003CFD69E3
MSMGDVERVEGYFSADSVTWEVLTAPATALMIAQITNLLEVPHLDFQSVLLDHDPLFPTNAKRQRGRRARRRKAGHFHDRLRRTLSVPLPIVFGDKEAAVACANHLFDYHRPMSGVGPDGATRYSATAPEAMLFAAVTITHAALLAYERFAFRDGEPPRRLDPARRDRYFAEMAQLAILMGVPAADIPISSAQVADYYAEIGEKFATRPGFRLAQLRTAAALMIPDSRADLGRTLADLGLMASALLAYAALPRPSRRLHGVPAFCDPLLAALRLISLPGFALLSVPAVGEAALRWYLGAADTEMLTGARSRIGKTSARVA